MIDIRIFKNEYGRYMTLLDSIVFDDLDYEKAVALCGEGFQAEFKTIEEFAAALVEIVKQYRRSVYMFYNMNGTVNENDFLKYFIPFLSADDEEKAAYETVNGVEYSELREKFCIINDVINKNLALGRKKRNRPFDKVMKTRMDRRDARQELVELSAEYAETVWKDANINIGNFAKYMPCLGEYSSDKV